VSRCLLEEFDPLRRFRLQWLCQETRKYLVDSALGVALKRLEKEDLLLFEAKDVVLIAN
jgi:hypothetical protein